MIYLYNNIQYTAIWFIKQHSHHWQGTTLYPPKDPFRSERPHPKREAASLFCNFNDMAAAFIPGTADRADQPKSPVFEKVRVNVRGTPQHATSLDTHPRVLYSTSEGCEVNLPKLRTFLLAPQCKDKHRGKLQCAKWNWDKQSTTSTPK